MGKIEREMGEKLKVLTVNVGARESIDRVRRYVRGHGIAYTVLFDTGARVTSLYRIRGIPAFFLVDDEGIIRYAGHTPPGDMDRYL